MDRAQRDERDRILRDVVAITMLGIALGVVYNWRGLDGRPPWGLSWIAEDRGSGLAALDALDGASADPMALVDGASGGVPEIPALDRPVEAGLLQVKRLHDAGTALFVDAREADEYAAGHIAGAINLPFDRASADPELLAALDDAGGPIVTYCGGGACELSLNLAWELVHAGQPRVLVYLGGYPEWEAAGYPTAVGEPPPGATR